MSKMGEVEAFAETKGVAIYYAWSVEDIRKEMNENWESEIDDYNSKEYQQEHIEYIKVLASISDEELFTLINNTYVRIYDENVFEAVQELVYSK
jgi:hypothetical protein